MPIRIPTPCFVLRSPKSNALTPILVILRFFSQRIVINTFLKILPAHWDKNHQKVKNIRAARNMLEINEQLTLISSKLMQITKEYVIMFDSIDLYKIKDIFEGKASAKTTSLSPMSFISEYIDSCRALKDPKTIISYQNTFKQLKGYEKRYSVKLEWDIIDEKFYSNFYIYLHIEGGYTSHPNGLKLNTFNKAIKNLVHFLNEAIIRGHHNVLKFKNRSFKQIPEQVHKIYLTQEELDRMLELDLSEGSMLCLVRDLFVCCCNLGLRYTDLANVRSEHIKTIDGLKVLDIITQKTNSRAIIPINSVVESILIKYNYTFRKCPTNPHFNRLIKEIGQMAEINEEVEIKKSIEGKVTSTIFKKYQLITLHSCRRTFVTNTYKAGIQVVDIRKMTV